VLEVAHAYGGGIGPAGNPQRWYAWNHGESTGPHREQCMALEDIGSPEPRDM
jgi:hypothetical protein